MPATLDTRSTSPTPPPAVGRTTEVIAALSSLIRSSRAIGRHRHDQLGASGTPLAVLKALAHADPHHDRPGDLATAAGVAPSVVSRVLAKLEDDGFVERRPDERDARACHIALTDAGRDQLDQVQREYEVLLDDALKDLADEDVARLPGLLRHLEDALARAADQAGPLRHPAPAPTTTDESR